MPFAVRAYLPDRAEPDHKVGRDSLQAWTEERTLLVSGPNTGGKTVLLKALGLGTGDPDDGQICHGTAFATAATR